MACKPRILQESEKSAESDTITMEIFQKIKEVILCPVCYDVYKSPVNVKQCLHKFCA